MHILGEIVGVSGLADGGVSLNFAVEADEQFWELISGSARAQSHVSYAMDDDIAVIAHPIDLHYRCSSMSVRGAPRRAPRPDLPCSLPRRAPRRAGLAS